MNKTFVFYTILTVIGSPAVFFLVAAFRRERFLTAQKRTLKFLDSYLRALPDWALSWGRAVGGATGFILLVALTYAFDQVGNLELEYTKRFFSSRDQSMAYLKWQVDNVAEWESKLGDYQKQWKKEHSTASWEDHNSKDLDKWQCRVSRTLFWFSLLLLIAGMVDIVTPRFRKRGAFTFLVGLFFSIATLHIYADRENHYIFNVVNDNGLLTCPVVMPQITGPPTTNTQLKPECEARAGD